MRVFLMRGDQSGVFLKMRDQSEVMMRDQSVV